MGSLASRIAEWLSEIEYKNLPSDVVEEVKKRVADSYGVAMAAAEAEPVKVARWVARQTSSPYFSSMLWTDGVRVAADHAVFANSCAIRFLDFNDTYLSKEALHPSDMIPAIMAATEISGSGGREFITALVAAYELACRLADAYSIRSLGFDHVTYIAIAAAAGAAKALGLDKRGVEHAINIATTISPALRQTRAGEISMWKACAAAHAAREGFLAAILAWRGMTGPSPVFEGKFGFNNVVLRGDSIRLDLSLDEFRVMRTSIKFWPVEYHAMSAVEAALRVREDLGEVKPDDIESVEIETFTTAYKIIVEDPEKWDPKTRETADHSLPYIVAVALLDGRVWLESFAEERVLASDVRKVMGKMRVKVNPEYDKIYPEGIPNRVRVRVRDGRVAEAESIYPPGHFRNPLDWAGVEEKVYRLMSNYGRPLVANALNSIKGLDSLATIDELTSYFRRIALSRGD